MGNNLEGKLNAIYFIDEFCKPRKDRRTVFVPVDLWMPENENEAISIFTKKLQDAVSGENIIYVISEKDQLELLPDQAVRTLVKADIDTIKTRFRERMHGNLPVPVEKMLEKKHGMFDEGTYDYIFDSTKDDADTFSNMLREKLCTK